MKQLIIVIAFIAGSLFSFAQSIDVIINSKEALRIENTLASNDMKGRKTGTPGNTKAALFIAEEFKKAGLQPADSKNGYLQKFAMVEAKVRSSNIVLGGSKLETEKLIAITPKRMLQVNEKSGYETGKIAAGDNLGAKAMSFVQSGKNYIVWVDNSFAKNFKRLNYFKSKLFANTPDVLFVLADAAPETYLLEVVQEVEEIELMNVVGVLPGKSKKEEYVIFSGHYDHLGVTDKPENGDSIYNGANDDAAGITAVIMLANYFKQLHNNERTIVFAAFTAEEIGGFGSQYFSKQYNPDKVAAMFNIEMIGTESKWGKNSAYITGYEKTDMGAILEKNLKGSAFSFHPDPYTAEQLFYRSDNATLARLGVPAHTISTSKMDSEPNYHKLSDEVSTLDIENMTEVIKAIAISSTSIIKGTDTPSRVNTADLK
ncbi:Peptidase family M28 [Filimonas lacunae]|uniref:Peptidase family M28 n=1 Tax=Filimonas lacunae TaxID=477680 RepID=A0A173MNP0_9BACT|nr:M20/M25/M40 family metallo-hydrolase [Filimonas lacunae]BAV09011.1 aminopeptidase [Filimonas lacunae]SIS65755.1 Peptidase family M28 [Filimonas lacunae]